MVSDSILVLLGFTLSLAGRMILSKSDHVISVLKVLQLPQLPIVFIIKDEVLTAPLGFI